MTTTTSTITEAPLKSTIYPYDVDYIEDKVNPSTTLEKFNLDPKLTSLIVLSTIVFVTIVCMLWYKAIKDQKRWRNIRHENVDRIQKLHQITDNFITPFYIETHILQQQAKQIHPSMASAADYDYRTFVETPPVFTPTEELSIPRLTLRRSTNDSTNGQDI